MTKKELSQLYYLKREIKKQEEKIKELEAFASNETSKFEGLNFSKGNDDKVGKYSAQIADLKSLRDLNLQKCFYELSRFERYIQSVDDSQMRQILYFRYVKCLSWQKVAFAMGEHDEQYPRRKHNKFLKKKT